MTILGALGGSLFLRAPYSPSAWRGYQIANRAGCFACHGPNGLGGVPNPRSVEGLIPPLVADAAFTFYVRSPEEIREWIAYGRPLHRGSTERFRQDGVIEMPAYERWLSDEEIDDLVVYVRTAAELDEPCDPAARRGRDVAVKYACFGCHGPAGSGGFMNPGSFKRSIPPWNSDDFDELVRDDRELRQWILTGGIDRFRENPAARFFIERQVIQMPAYADKIADDELEALIEYIKWVRDPSELGVCEKEWVARAQAAEGTAEENFVARGAVQYRERGCAACHGAEGKGGVRNANHRVEKVPALHDLAIELGLYKAGEAEAVVRWLAAGAPENGLSSARLTDLAMFRDNLRRQLEIVERGADSQKRNPEGEEPPMDMPAWRHMRGGASGSDPGADIRSIFAYLISLQDWSGTP